MRIFTSRDGTRIASEVTGAGPPLVVLHGSSADHNRWAGVAPALAARHTVHAVDRRGRGASGDAADYSLEREADDLVAVVEGIGGPVDVLGHSYGALVALEAAPRLTALRRLALYEPPAHVGYKFMPPGIVERLEALLGDPETLVSTFLGEVARVAPDDLALMRTLPAWRGRLASAHTLPRELRASEAHRVHAERLAGFSAPTTLLLGGASSPHYREAGAAVLAAVPHARQVILDGQQHIAMDTAPDLFVREVLAFLDAP